MSRKQYHIRLTGADRVKLRQIIHAGRSAARRLDRARILLLADTGTAGPALTDREVATAVDVSSRTVARVRMAWCIQGWEALERKVRATPPTPPRLDGDQEAHLIAIACSTPPAGYARWSLRLLADRVVEQEIVEAISYETVRQVLKKTTSSRGVSSGM
ncbi:MAG TPA: helix-turn-helix domain-containing protein [Thermomicrobiales bacterium]|nr:helix-turn-helix domain-containing protein [Thermomicrobiales bacterium]